MPCMVTLLECALHGREKWWLVARTAVGKEVAVLPHRPNEWKAFLAARLKHRRAEIVGVEQHDRPLQRHAPQGVGGQFGKLAKRHRVVGRGLLRALAEFPRGPQPHGVGVATPRYTNAQPRIVCPLA